VAEEEGLTASAPLDPLKKALKSSVEMPQGLTYDSARYHRARLDVRLPSRVELCIFGWVI